MENGVVKIIKLRAHFHCLRMLLPVRTYSDVPNLREEEEKKVAIGRVYPNLITQYWNEKSALKLRRKQKSFPYSLKSNSDFIKAVQDLKNIPLNFMELYRFIIKRMQRKDMINQEYYLKRELVLKPDLAAATFIVHRGGSIKFFKQPTWVGIREEKKTLPVTYVPGLHVEAINAENTKLNYVGLQNLRKLKYLKTLSLRGLDEITDWCLDYVSKEFYATLTHLDLSNCINVTHRGLSCFYRFECLKHLNLTGVPDSPELKMACLMLLDINPHLVIKGVNYSIPEKIEPVMPEEIKHISDEVNPISEKSNFSLQETKTSSEDTKH